MDERVLSVELGIQTIHQGERLASCLGRAVGEDEIERKKSRWLGNNIQSLIPAWIFDKYVKWHTLLSLLSVQKQAASFHERHGVVQEDINPQTGFQTAAILFRYQLHAFYFATRYHKLALCWNDICALHRRTS